MESIKVENLTFTYPGCITPALKDVSFSVNNGEFVTLCGRSGCGKSTLLRLMKSPISPYGNISGKIFFEGCKLDEIPLREQCEKIGFVFQNPENGIVTDKVWHELAFGLENLGRTESEIHISVAETASFFGIEDWFCKDVSELSGGQKQILSLASVMAMHPSALILDEPTGQLDPIAVSEFIRIIYKINRELGITVILSEHRLEDVFPISDRVIVLEDGKLAADASPAEICGVLKERGSEMYMSLPSPMKIFAELEENEPVPLTVREGRERLERFADRNPVYPERIPEDAGNINDAVIAAEMREIWFRYDKKTPDILKGLSLKVNCGEIFSIVGGNGAGKSTALSVLSGLLTPYSGEVFIYGKKLCDIKDPYNKLLGVLPQNPQTLFIHKTVYLDLQDMLAGLELSCEEKEKMIISAAEMCDIARLLGRHPYDLSGGEQQRAALAKILLKSPKIILLDEPTKGMDACFKENFADILYSLKSAGVTVIMVSHDIEFCAAHSDRCAMLFDGVITGKGTPRELFTGNNFYTTSVCRMSRTVFPKALLCSDVLAACGYNNENFIKKPDNRKITESIYYNLKEENSEGNKKESGITKWRLAIGCLFALIFLAICIFGIGKAENGSLRNIYSLAAVLDAVICLAAFFPHNSGNRETKINSSRNICKSTAKKLPVRTKAAAIISVLASVLTIYIGFFLLDRKHYYIVSIIIIIETLIPFFMIFEKRRPQARELIIVSVMCAIAVAGRTAFYMIPQFKPVLAIVIISGVCLGGETGFLVGAVTAFVSNFFFGQGAWTPWQMFSFGIIGFVSGVIFRKGLIRRSRLILSVYGAFATILIYGGIMNPASVILAQQNPTAEMLIASYALGFPFDCIHACATAIFLWFASEAMIEKLDRIKLKYGLIDER